ncbi:MAG TPA: mechanosensitive ion channel domain-containing protein [Acidimicrobiales bacterium]|jgi:moderate conductance mechanosensitive channel|nr:mechanosensitive ion channel domain-containing protein [Acidimicrobiales bacterium]
MADEHGYVYDLLRKIGLTDFGARTGEFLLVRPLKIVLVVVIAMIASRLAVRTIRRAIVSFKARTPLGGTNARAEQRASTLADVFASLARSAIWGVTTLVVLDILGINLAPLIAGAGIAGIAIGFGAQALVRDVISGLFVLLEDQYGVGDIVTIGDSSGTVEDITLRMTRLRGADGTVWFVPNGEVRRVGNSSMEWSRVAVDVLVAHGTDLGAAQSEVMAAAADFAGTPEWANVVLDLPEMWGVQAIEEKGVRLRLLVRTAPRQQYVVARELRSRLAERLTSAGFAGPGTDQVLVSAGALDLTSPPPPART